METAFNYMPEDPHTHTHTSSNLKTLFCIMTFDYYFKFLLYFILGIAQKGSP